MVAVDPTLTSQAIAIVGGYIIIVGLVSYLLKNRLFISEALLALALGIAVGPIALNWFNPLDWTGSQDNLNTLTYEITRIVIGIQVLFTGIALPKAYLWREKRSILVLIGPIMVLAWFSSSLLIWAFVRQLTFLEALVIGACVTPTDPVLANSVCKGRFAEKHVPLHVRNIIVCESGANDGLGFPFLFLATYLVMRHQGGETVHTIGWAVGTWAYNIIAYQILLSCAIGAVIGTIARIALKWAEQRELVDHDNFLAFGVGLAFFTLGTVGCLGSDDILCCFIAGNAFTWDDWFRVQTEDHAFQDVIDTLLNSAIFLYIGSILPWNDFNNYFGLTPWRLIVLGILVMILRRVPWVLALMKAIPTLPTIKEAAFAGFFGPIGVGAVYYVQVALQTLPEERVALRGLITPVVYFMVLTSVIVHGITIPVGKSFTTIQRIHSTRNSTNGSDQVSRLNQAPKTLPIREEGDGMHDAHDDLEAEELAARHPAEKASNSPADSDSTPPATPRRPDPAIRFDTPQQNGGGSTAERNNDDDEDRQSSISEPPTAMTTFSPVSILQRDGGFQGGSPRGTPTHSRSGSPRRRATSSNLPVTRQDVRT